MATNNSELIQKRLREPFPSSEVRWRSWEKTPDNTRALMVPYIDVRSVMERLDEVMGIGGWQTNYTVMGTGDVMCNLRLKIDGEWVQRGDVGQFQVENQSQASGMAVKGAFSDALKRSAVNFGIGRYLYSIPKQWVDWDAKARMPKVEPSIPEEFLCEKEREEVRRRKSSNGKYVPPPAATEAPKPGVPAIARHAVLWKNLNQEDQSQAKGFADRICALSGPTGSRKELLDWKEKFAQAKSICSDAAKEYLDAYFQACWEMTPGNDLLHEPVKESEQVSVPHGYQIDDIPY